MESENDTRVKDDEQDSYSGSRPGSSARPVSALARGVQITEFAESRVNPTPLLLEESDILLEQYLSPGKLVRLRIVTSINICIIYIYRYITKLTPRDLMTGKRHETQSYPRSVIYFCISIYIQMERIVTQYLYN